jgi:hypothetical protein
MPVVCSIEGGATVLEAWRYGTSSASSFFSSGIWSAICRCRTGDDGTSIYIESAHFGGNIDGIVDVCSRRVLVEGGVSKLVFGDENPELDCWLDSSLSARVRLFPS